MSLFRPFSFLFFIIFSSLGAQEKLEISNASVFGSSWTSSKEDIIKILGEPTGLVQLKEGGTIALWGNQLSIEFNKKNSQIEKINLSESISKLSELNYKKFDIDQIIVFKFIRIQMSLLDVMTQIKEQKLKIKSRLPLQIIQDGFIVSLYSGDGPNESSQNIKIISIEISKEKNK